MDRCCDIVVTEAILMEHGVFFLLLSIVAFGATGCLSY